MVRIVGLRDLNEEDQAEDGQSYYAGGAGNQGQGSGQMIVEPPDRGSGLMGRMMDMAEPVSESDLGNGASVGGSGQASEMDGPGEVMIINVTVWEDGFSIDDGPLRHESNPDDGAMLRAIMTGDAHLLIAAKIAQDNEGQEEPPAPSGMRPRPVDLKLHNKKDQKYVAPPAKPFAGAGNSLGAALEAATAGDASAELVVDDSKPKTKIQIRLASGERVVQEFNLDHTINDVHNFAASRHDPGSFELMCTFPRKTLSDKEQTVEAAGIQGAAITQRAA